MIAPIAQVIPLSDMPLIEIFIAKYVTGSPRIKVINPNAIFKNIETVCVFLKKRNTRNKAIRGISWMIIGKINIFISIILTLQIPFSTSPAYHF